MSDMGEAFKAWRKDKKAIKGERLESMKILLKEKGILFKEGANNILLIREGISIDAYPTTKRWKFKGNYYMGSPSNMIKFIFNRMDY